MNTREKENYEALENAAQQAAKKTGAFLKQAFTDMKESAKDQHEIDKANFEAVKAESKANFEANRGRATLERVQAEAKERAANLKK